MPARLPAAHADGPDRGPAPPVLTLGPGAPVPRPCSSPGTRSVSPLHAPAVADQAFRPAAVLCAGISALPCDDLAPGQGKPQETGIYPAPR